jgi:hypothetical protein
MGMKLSDQSILEHFVLAPGHVAKIQPKDGGPGRVYPVGNKWRVAVGKFTSSARNAVWTLERHLWLADDEKWEGWG